MVERMRSRVSEGMSVKSSDGEKLGKVVACQPTGFVVEKGFLFPRDLIVPYERITAIANGEIVLSLARAELGETGAHAAAATATGAVASARAGASTFAEEVKGAARNLKDAVSGEAKLTKEGSLEAFGATGEICVPLTEEEVVASKRVEKVGEVHIRKEIVTEEKQFTIPVTREVIRVERVPVSHEARAEDKPFEEASYDIPIREEHVTLEKHSVVREELHIGKELQKGEETASATVRRERAEVETMGPVRRAEGRGGALSEAAASMRPTGSGNR